VLLQPALAQQHDRRAVADRPRESHRTRDRARRRRDDRYIGSAKIANEASAARRISSRSAVHTPRAPGLLDVKLAPRDFRPPCDKARQALRPFRRRSHSPCNTVVFQPRLPALRLAPAAALRSSELIIPGRVVRMRLPTSEASGRVALNPINAAIAKY
jgi:hypothetical protein